VVLSGGSGGDRAGLDCGGRDDAIRCSPRLSSVNDLTREAVSIALRDAGAELGDIDAAYFGNTAHGLLEGRHVATGQVALRSMGFERIPIINVEMPVPQAQQHCTRPRCTSGPEPRTS
jgi:hypothetical protein